MDKCVLFMMFKLFGPEIITSENIYIEFNQELKTLIEKTL